MAVSNAGSRSRWRLLWAMPNIKLSRPFENDVLAIAPFEDCRVQEAIREPAAKIILSAFEDKSGKQFLPPAMVYDSDASEAEVNQQSVIDFRNSVAMSCLSRSWADTLSDDYGTLHGHLWSDYFDFYPLMPTAKGTSALEFSPAIFNGGDFTGVRLQPTPGLGTPKEVQPGTSLLKSLLALWEDTHHQSEQPLREGYAVFRSLHLAYLAAAMPARNWESVFEYGTHIGLWVAAIENLLHPGEGNIGKGDVIKFVAALQWHSQALAEMTDIYPTGKKKAGIPCTWPVRLLYELYSARNDFLHGNPAQARNLHVGLDPSRHNLLGGGCLLFARLLRWKLGLDAPMTRGFPEADYCFESVVDGRLEEALLNLREHREGLGRSGRGSAPERNQ